MSDSEQKSENEKSRRSKRGVVVKFQFDDTSSDESQVAGPSNRNRSTKRSRQRLLSSDNSSSSDSDFTLTSIRNKQNKQAKPIPAGDDSDESSDDTWNPQQKKNAKKSENAPQQNLIESDSSATDSDSSSSDALEKCPICLHSFREQEIGVPDVCEHDFCAPCIEEWSNNVQTCPIDRKPFTIIRIREKYGGAFVREVGIEKPTEAEPQIELEFTNCEVCQRSDREDSMLLCDGCDAGYHMECLVPQLTEVPEGSWYCDNCFASDLSEEDDITQVLAELETIDVPPTRLRIRREVTPRIARTRQSERIRATIRSRRNNIVDSNTNPMPGPSFEGSQRTTTRTTTTTTTTTTTRTTTTSSGIRKKKKRKATRKRKPRTYIVEYDIDEYNNKFASSRRVIKRRKRRTRRKPSKKCASRNCGSSNNPLIETTVGGARGERLRQHYPKLHLFGNKNALEYFSDDSGGDEGMDSLNNSIDTGDGLMVRAAIRSISSRQRLRCKNIGSIPSTAVSSEGGTDILSNIMDTMTEWHSVSRPSTIERIKINADGSLIYEKKAKKLADSKKADGDPHADILNAPLYPGNGTTVDDGNRSLNDTNSFHGGNVNQNTSDNGHIADTSRNSEQFQSSRGGQSTNTPNRSNFVSESFSFRNQNRNQIQRPRRSEAQRSLYDGEDDMPIRSESLGELEASVDTETAVLKEKTSIDESNEANQNMSPEQSQEEQPPNCGSESSGNSPSEPTTIESNSTSNDQSMLNDQPNVAAGGSVATQSNYSSSDEAEHEFQYSKESMQVAKDTRDDESDKESAKQEQTPNDETIDNDEDLVQLDDDEHFANETIDDTINEQKNENNIDGGSTIESPMSSPRSPNDDDKDNNTNETSANIDERDADQDGDRSIEGNNDNHGANAKNIPAAQKCSDNKSDQDRREQNAGIEGMDTEMISDDENILPDDQASRELKADKENNNSGNDADESFKKVSKNNRDRNYRDKKEKNDAKHRSKRSRSKSPRVRSPYSRSRSRSRSRNRNKKDRDVKRKDKRRQEIQRYDVRTVIADRQPKQYKDKYGRDTSRPPKRSRTQTPSPNRSRSRSPRLRSRSLSRSITPNARRRSLSRSSFRRRSVSPRRRNSVSRLRKKRRSFSRSPVHFSHSRSRSRSRSLSPRHPHYQLQAGRSRSRSRSRSRDRKSRKKPIDKKVNKIRAKKKPTTAKKPYYSPGRRSPANQRNSIPKSWEDREWNRSMSNGPNESWTPPIAHAPENLTVIVDNSKEGKRDKKREKKRKAEKRKDPLNKKEKRKRGDKQCSPAVPSKEVFASGDNILVSVSFNKEKSQQQQQTTIVTLPPTKDQILSKKSTEHRDDRSKRSRRSARDGSRRHRKLDTKPVAIIDLDNSPFKEMTPSPKAVIVLSDSDHESDKPSKNQHGYSKAGNLAETESDACDNHDASVRASSPPQSPINDPDPFELSLGPKTPPEPHLVKFSLSTNMKTKLRTGINPLHDNDDDDEDVDDEDRLDNKDSNNESNSLSNAQSAATPPGPTSPDVYDPFEPTKSASQSPSDSEHANADENKRIDDISKPPKPVDLVMAFMNSKASVEAAASKLSNTLEGENNETNNASDDTNVSPYKDKSNDEPIATAKSSGIHVLSNILLSSSKDVSSRLQQPQAGPSRALPNLSAGNSISPMKYGIGSIISKLPLPKMSKPMRHNGNDDDMDIASPYSPGADDYEDLFEPPPASPSNQQSSTSHKKHSSRMTTTKPAATAALASSKIETTFDDLFGGSPINKKQPKRRPSKHSSSIKGYGKLNEEQLRILDDVPGSAVELQNKDKFLRKLNRQERVIEEVKLVLKPHYNKKHVTKDEYKDIMRRAVPKICHNRTGEINPKKIKKLIEAYVAKFRQKRKQQQSSNVSGK